MIGIVAAVVLTLVGPDDPPKSPQPPAEAKLAAISARGKDLAGYDQAAWHASDAVQAQPPKEGSVTGYVARKTEKGWVVAFGRLSDDQKSYLVAVEATQGKRPDEFTVQAFDPPKPDPGFPRAAARAIEVTLKDFAGHLEGGQRPYNVAVLPADAGKLWVYFTPAPTEPNVWPIGADVRYLVAADGGKVEARRPLHKAIIENRPPQGQGPDQKLAAGVHTHILTETPEDTDVLHVLSRKPATPEMIVTRNFVFAIEPTGEVKYVGKTAEMQAEP